MALEVLRGREYESIERELRAWLQGAKKLVIMGIGCSLRRDDFVGVQIVRGLRNRVSNKVHLIECETVPESSIEPVTELKPTHILIVDAALLNLPPGSAVLIEPSRAGGASISTHALPLSLLSEYLSHETGAKITLLAVQPKETGFGEGLSDELDEAHKSIIELLAYVLSDI